MSFSRFTKPLNKVRSTIKYGDIGNDAIRVPGKGSVNLRQSAGASYNTKSRAAHKAYLDQWGPMPEDVAPSSVKRVDKFGNIDDYTE